MIKKEVKSINIYGLGWKGQMFYNLCKVANINVVTGIDRNSSINIQGLNIYRNCKGIPECDATIVTFEKQGNEAILREINNVIFLDDIIDTLVERI